MSFAFSFDLGVLIYFTLLNTLLESSILVPVFYEEGSSTDTFFSETLNYIVWAGGHEDWTACIFVMYVLLSYLEILIEWVGPLGTD